MLCTACGQTNDQGVHFCRRCGTGLVTPAPFKNDPIANRAHGKLSTRSQDPDELTGKGIGKIFAGDGFFFVGILLSVMESSVHSLAWLFLLIPAFALFGLGVSDLFYARQIRRRLSDAQAIDQVNVAELKPGGAPSVTERTTRNLKLSS